jgi:hypothetical protein
MKILLEDLYTKVGREDIFKLTSGNESLHEISSNNGFRVVEFVTSKNLSIALCSYITSTFADGKTHNQIDHVLIDKIRHSSVVV